MKLYYSAGACSLSPHIALEESGLPYEAISAPTKTKLLPDGSDYRKVNPLGYVPYLINDQGEGLAEGPAIVQYIADLIEYRSRNESLVEKVGTRTLQTAYGEFTAHAFRDKPSQAVHLALVKGQWSGDDVVPVRVHEPLSVFDALEVNRSMHSWGLDTSLQYLSKQGQGVAVLLNCGETAAQLLAQFEGTARSAQAPERGRMDLRTYGVGAQILRECGVHKMALMGQPRRMPSMAGYGLEITGFIPKE